MGRRRRNNWKHGDLFAIPLVDGSFGIVQAIDHWTPHLVYVAVTDLREAVLPNSKLNRPARVIALIAVSADVFDSGASACLGDAPALASREDFPNEQLAHIGYVGAKSYTGGILVDFLSAWHGVGPWSPYKDPNYFDKMLVSGVERPAKVAAG